MKLEKILTFFFFFLIFIYFIRPLSSDGDFYHHINIGRYVVKNLKLPHYDEFTFTANGKEFIGYAWASGVVFYLIYNQFGAFGINLLLAVIALITFILLYFLLKSYRLQNKTVFIVLAFAASVISTRWPDRPEIFVYPLLISVLFIDRIRSHYPKLTLLYPLIILLWANLYGSSVLLGLLILSSLFLFGKKDKIFFLSILFSFLTSLLNGYGLKSIFFFTLIPRMNKLLGDWEGIISTLRTAPLDYALQFQYKLLIYLIYLIFFIIIVFISRKKIKDYFFLFILSLSILLPFYAIRMLVYGIILSLPLFAIFLSDLFKNHLKLAWITIIAVSITIVLSFWVSPPGFGEDKDSFPPQLVQFIKNNNLTGRVFNTQRIGGFLTYHFFPKILVFADTRDELFLKDSPLTEVATSLSNQSNFLNLLNKYKVDIVIADLSEGTSYKSLFYSDLYIPIYMTDRYVLSIKKGLASAKKLTVLNAIDPFSDSGAKQNLEKKAIDQYNYLITTQPASYYLKFFLAASLSSLQKYDSAINILSELRTNDSPSDLLLKVEKDYSLGKNYLLKQDCNNSKTFFDKTAEDVKGKFIFSPFKEIPSSLDLDYANYYLSCKSNSVVARSYLDKYLNQAGLNALEKFKIRAKFEQLIKQN